MWRNCLKPRNVLLLLLLLGGCSTTPRPYPDLKPEGSAKLHVDETTSYQFFVMPDGDRCGKYFLFSPDQVPFVRPDRTLLLKPKKRFAMQLIWVGKIEREFLCSAIVSLRVVPDGEYKLLTEFDGSACSVDVTPLNAYSKQGFEIRKMERTDTNIPSKCKPAIAGKEGS